MSTFSYGTQWPVYRDQWNQMEAKDDEWRAQYKALGLEAISYKPRYQPVECDTGVPWMLIAAIHMREASFDFSTYLGNGEPLDQVTELVPAGRGPFDSWEEGAIDALTYDGLNEVIDWRLEKMLYHAERYNGLGYYNKGIPSPYVWAGTNIQEPGKYVADGVWDADYWDTQPGVAGLLYAIHRLDPPAQYQRETAAPDWLWKS